MDNIEKVFEEKNFDRKTLELIENFLIEFDDLFGKYVSREEVIRRIKENLDHSIEFKEFESKSILGEYNATVNKISLKEGLDEKQLKDVFFHEMVHCITKDKDCVGFFREVFDKGGKPRRVQVTGFTEGFTQYVSRIRAEKYGGDTNSYPILTEQVQNMVSLTGEDNFLNMAFNNRESFADLLIDSGLIMYPGEESQLLEQFDILWLCERDIYAAKMNSGTEMGDLMKAILRKKSLVSQRLNDARTSIINTYLARYESKIDISKKDLEEIYNLTNTYSEQLALDEQHEAYSMFFQKISQLEKLGMAREEILEMVPDRAKTMVEHEMNFEDLASLDSTEWLNKLAKESVKLYDDVIDGDFEEYYLERIAHKIFKGDVSNRYAVEVSCALISGLAETILAKGYNVDTLSFEIIPFKTPGQVFNFYNSNGETLEYLGTFSTINEHMTAEELQICTDEEKRKEILSKKPNLSEKDVMFVSKSGFILGYTGDENYVAIDENGASFENDGEVIYNSSYAENIVQIIKGTISRYQRLQQLGAPQVILQEESKRIRKLNGLIRNYKGKTKFVPQDVECAVQNVSLEEITDILAEITVPGISSKESLEKGIGFDEH